MGGFASSSFIGTGYSSLVRAAGSPMRGAANAFIQRAAFGGRGSGRVSIVEMVLICGVVAKSGCSGMRMPTCRSMRKRHVVCDGVQRPLAARLGDDARVAPGASPEVDGAHGLARLQCRS